MAGENYINHVALVLDASTSMSSHTNALIRVADEQVKHLAKRSQEMDQETRITVYTFADQVKCLIYDKDVLRLPSISTLYRANGMTALIDATMQSQEDLEHTWERYGDHAFLTYVLTDGQENRSRKYGPTQLRAKLESQPDHWTVAVFVPDIRGEQYARQCGFFPGNIAIWDTKTQKGLEDSFTVIRQATDGFMTARKSGVRGTRSLFSMALENVNKDTVKQAGLKPLSKSVYEFLKVEDVAEIRPFVQSHGFNYTPGCAYYQLTKREKIQPQKSVALREKKSGRVYTGKNARDLLGLPDYEVSVSPEANPIYEVYVQSTSVNRKLMPGTKVLLVN